MRIREMRIVGFQAFKETNSLVFESGINLIVGQNNSGKSSALRALQADLPDDRYRSPEKWKPEQLPMPEIHLTIEVSGEDIIGFVHSHKNISLPVQPNDPEVFLQKLLSMKRISVSFVNRPGQDCQSTYPSHGLFKLGNTQNPYNYSVSSINGIITFEGASSRGDALPNAVREIWRQNMFYFSAERLAIGESGNGYAKRLSPDARNLPNVLMSLLGESGDLFDKLVRHVRAIFPTVGNISVRMRPENSNLEIRVWPTEQRQEVNLSFPLNSSGTGVSQVVAILTAIITLKSAVIVIDEIDNFLHPAAVKNLLRIIQTEYSENQYIISTHAPEVISSSNPSNILIMKRIENNSQFETIKLDDLEKFRSVAQYLGISVADVFAAENVVWVEGPTEELCFPYLFEVGAGEQLPRNTKFISVIATGDFFSKRRDYNLVWEVYDRLSSASNSLVTSVSFSFDSERLTTEEKQDLFKKSRGLVRFLPRRHLECYLLDPTALAEFINQRDIENKISITHKNIEEEIAFFASKQPFLIKEWDGNINNVDWQKNVDAAKLISEIVQKISHSRVYFNKKTDTLKLLQIIEPIMIEELTTFVAKLVNKYPDVHPF
jgi:predicted ATPase